MAEYVFAVMTQAMFHPNYGGKLAKGDVIECTKEDAIRMRRVNVAKPATKEQVAEWKAKRASDQPDDIEAEEYISSERAPDVTDEEVAASFDEGVDEYLEEEDDDADEYDEKKQKK